MEVLRELVAQGTVASSAVGGGMGPVRRPCLRPRSRELASYGADLTQRPGNTGPDISPKHRPCARLGHVSVGMGCELLAR